MSEVAAEKVEVEREDDALIPIAVLIDELRNSELQIRLNAIRKLPTIALALGAERTRQELLAFICETIYDEDQVTHELARQLGDFITYVGGTEYAHLILPALENFSNVEEAVVRDEAVKSMKKIAAAISSDHVEEHFVPLIIRLSRADWFTSRTSACGLISTAYQYADGAAARTELEDAFVDLCRDETPMVRRAAAKALAELVPVYNTTMVEHDLLPIFNHLTSDQHDSVRILTVDAAIEFARYFTDNNMDFGPIKTQLLSYFTDQSWRVRYKSAQKIVDLVKAVSNDFVIEEVVPSYENLLRAPENEVRTTAFENGEAFCTALDPSFQEDVILQRFLPACKYELEQMGNENVKIAVSSAVMGVVPFVSKGNTVEHILPLCSTLLMGEPSQVRLNVIWSFGKLSKAVGTEEALRSLLPAVMALSDDGKWRVRHALVGCITSLITQLDAEQFEAGLLGTCLGWLDDRANKVRMSASQFLQYAVQQFGSDWAEAKILPVLEHKATEESSMFQSRMTAVRCLRDLGFALDSERIVGKVIPILVKLSQDPVANIRFNVATCLEMVGPKLGEETVNQHIKPIIVKLLDDPENDVKFFAKRASSALGIGSA